MTRALHLEFGRHLYGGALQVAYLLRGLAESHPGIDNHVILPDSNPLPQHVPESDRIHLHPFPIGGELDVRVWFRLRRLVREVRPDLIHIHSRRGADLWGVLLARRTGIPYILTRRVVYPEKRWLIRWRTAKAAFVAGISTRVCEMMAECGVPEPRLRCILSTVDTEAWRPQPDPNYFREETGLDPSVPVIAMIGQLIEGKGHRVLFEAVSRIVKAHPEVRFLLFGKGHLDGKLRESVAAQPWREAVRFMGFRTDLVRLMPGFDIVAHPAFHEGLGVSLLQAASCAVPIVASNAGGIPEIVHHDRNGYLIEPGDAAALADYLVRLLDDAALRRKMGSAGRELAETRFSIARMAADYAGLYRDIQSPR